MGRIRYQPSDLANGTIDQAMSVLERLERMADALESSGLAIEVVVSVDVVVRVKDRTP